MKKIVLAAALLLTSVATFAQHEVGDFTIQPKVGLNIANKGHKTKCNKMEDDRKRLYMLIFNQLGRN